MKIYSREKLLKRKIIKKRKKSLLVIEEQDENIITYTSCVISFTVPAF